MRAGKMKKKKRTALIYYLKWFPLYQDVSLSGLSLNTECVVKSCMAETGQQTPSVGDLLQNNFHLKQTRQKATGLKLTILFKQIAKSNHH